MKLQTMLFPTGEFAIIASGIGEYPNKETIESFGQFREDSGATSLLVTDQAVEVENAVVDELARRPWVEVTDDWDGDGGGFDPDDGEPEEDPAKILHFPRLVAEGGQAFTATFELQNPAALTTLFGGPVSNAEFLRLQAEDRGEFVGAHNDAGDTILAKQLDDGAEFSPAGLVVSGTKTTAELEPELTEALQRDRVEASFAVQTLPAEVLTLSSYFGGAASIEAAEDALATLAGKLSTPKQEEIDATRRALEWSPKEGDRVKIIGPAVYSENAPTSGTGTVDSGPDGDGDIYVKTAGNSWYYYQASSLAPVE